MNPQMKTTYTTERFKLRMVDRCLKGETFKLTKQEFIDCFPGAERDELVLTCESNGIAIIHNQQTGDVTFELLECILKEG
jgi:hypothetical protein